jgi:tRNA A-37 threonylcarbamoyl transferase component Bud32
MMTYQGFFSPVWQEIFAFNGIMRFEDIWRLGEGRNAVAPEHQVIQTELNLPYGGKTMIFIKRHCEPGVHARRKNKVALHNELNFLWLLKKLQIPTAVPIYFHSESGTTERAVLVMCQLTHFVSLRNLWVQWRLLQPSFNLRLKVMTQLAHTIAQLHRHKIAHGNLTEEHIYLRYRKLDQGQDCDHIHVALVGLGNAQACWSRAEATRRDLLELLQTGRLWSCADKLRFYKLYRGISVLTRRDRRFIRRLFKQAAKLYQSA